VHRELIVAETIALLGRQQVDLVLDAKARFVAGFKFLQDTIYLGVLFGRKRAAR
jgi:hypothetical protein